MRAKFNAVEKKAVRAFVARAAASLRLADWDISVDFDTSAPEDAVAAITHEPRQKRATIRLGAAQFLTSSAEHQRQTLVHELTHCHLFDLQATVEMTLRAAGASEFAVEVVNERLEWATDSLADALSALTANLEVPAAP